jgi:pimeloyl-ACP methyl ester carboxylesterase
MTRSALLLSAATALVLAAIEARAADVPPPAASAPRETPCHIDGFETSVRCVTLEVARDYDDPRGATLAITAAIAPALSATPEPDPLIVLAGGPGQAATDMGAAIDPMFGRVRRTRDIVLFDIRGTGRSGKLDCGEPPEGVLGATVLAEGGARPPVDNPAQLGDFARRCAARLGAAAEKHSFREVVEDLDRFRAAMGWARIDLWGGSFGTRLALHYVRAHGAHVRAIVLDATAPQGLSAFVSVPRTSQAALDRLFTDCAGDADCARDFPLLRENFESLLARLDNSPEVVTLPEPRSGRPQTYVFDGDAVRGLVFGGLYVSLTRAMLPLAIAHGDKGDFAPLLAVGAATGSWSGDTMALGETFSVLCAEDWRQSRDAPLTERSGGFMSDYYFRSFDAACRAWPSEPIPADMRTPFRSAVPALAISGALDPVTPPELAEQTLAQFDTSVHLVIPGGYHTNSTNPCAARVMAAFIEAPATGGRDQSCVREAAAPRFAGAISGQGDAP